MENNQFNNSGGGGYRNASANNSNLSINTNSNANDVTTSDDFDKYFNYLIDSPVTQGGLQLPNGSSNNTNNNTNNMQQPPSLLKQHTSSNPNSMTNTPTLNYSPGFPSPIEQAQQQHPQRQQQQQQQQQEQSRLAYENILAGFNNHPNPNPGSKQNTGIDQQLFDEFLSFASPASAAQSIDSPLGFNPANNNYPSNNQNPINSQVNMPSNIGGAMGVNLQFMGSNPNTPGSTTTTTTNTTPVGGGINNPSFDFDELTFAHVPAPNVNNEIPVFPSFENQQASNRLRSQRHQNPNPNANPNTIPNQNQYHHQQPHPHHQLQQQQSQYSPVVSPPQRSLTPQQQPQYPQDSPYSSLSNGTPVMKIEESEGAFDSMLQIPLPAHATSTSTSPVSSSATPQIFVQHPTLSKSPPQNSSQPIYDYSNLSTAATNNSSYVDLLFSNMNSNSNSTTNIQNQMDPNRANISNSGSGNPNYLSTHNFQGDAFTQARITSSTNLSDMASPYLSADESNFEDDSNSAYNINLNSSQNDHEISATIGALNLNNNLLTEKNLLQQNNYNSHNKLESPQANYISPLLDNTAQEAAAKTPSLFSHSSRGTTPINGRSRSNSANERPRIKIEDTSNVVSANPLLDDYDLESSPYSNGNAITPGTNQNQNFLSLPSAQDEHNSMRVGRQRRHSESRSNSNSRSRSTSRSHSGNNYSSGYDSDTKSDISVGSNGSKRSNASGVSSSGGKKSNALFECHICGKKLTRQYNLKSHLRTHSNEKPYVCDVCGKAFARQHDRNRHKNLHTGEKQYQCKGFSEDGTEWGCGKVFPRTDALRRHLQTDSGKECIRALVEESFKKRQGAKRVVAEPSSGATSPEDTLAAASVAVAFAAAAAAANKNSKEPNTETDKKATEFETSADNEGVTYDEEPPPAPISESRPDIDFSFS